MKNFSEARTIVRKKKSSDIEAGYDKQSSTESRSHARTIAKIDENQKNKNLKSRADRIAGDFIYVRNFVVKKLEELYPDKIWKRKVDRYYPSAQHGPLHVDEPSTMDEWIDLDKKALFMREHGLRYVALMPGGSEMDDMEAIYQCGPQPLKQ